MSGDETLTGFDFDPNKSRLNLAKHKVSFEVASRIWEGYVFEWDDNRKAYGERRVIALGAVEGRTLVIVYTPRGTLRRLISARKANSREHKVFAQAHARLGIEEQEKD